MIYTVDCPDEARILQTFGMIEVTTLIEKSRKGALRTLLEGSGAGHQDALERFISARPAQANAIVGVRIATAGLAAGDGALFLAITYIGTPVLLAVREGG